MSASDWSFARVWDGLAQVRPERPAIQCGNVTRTHRELSERAHRLAAHLHASGVRPGDTVAICLLNRPEYLEAFYAALLLGAGPVNVNYRYGPDEVAYLLADAGAAAIVTEPAFADTCRQADDRARASSGRRRPLVVTGPEYEAALAGANPDGGVDHELSGDDIVYLYTGGTTGMPKGVMWRSDDLYVALWQMARPGTEPPDPIGAARAGKHAATALPACPLMHGTGLFIALSTLSGGGTVVLVDRPGLDADLLWSEVERCRVQVLTIVGDAFARPLLEALDAHPDRWDLSSLRAITSSGVTWSPDVKRGLLAHLPGVTLLDSLGASEGLMTRSSVTAADAEIRPARFAVNDRVKVLTEDGREVLAGSGDVGMVAVGGRIPLGYRNDPEKTAATFRTVGGVRYSIPGDYATVDDRGEIQLLGRGSATVNTGGEKVYPEEVEHRLRAHPAVVDCVVVGVPDPRLGSRVVAVVELRREATAAAEPVAADAAVTEDELRSFCRETLAGYKVPRAIVFVESLGRSAAGKADYRRLSALAEERLAAPLRDAEQRT